jgi:acetyl-CoA C-acetyltransferase
VVRPDIWLAAGVRTPFAKVDGSLAEYDAIALSVPVVRHMLDFATEPPDFCVWGAVVPNLTWSNIAREILMDAGASATIPAFSTVMACGTSMIGAIEAACMIDGDRNLALVGGVDSLSHIPLGLGQTLSNWVRKLQQSRSLGQKIAHAAELRLGDLRLFIPSVTNRTTGLSMGEHTEITAKEWNISRAKLPASFDRTTGKGSLTAGNSSPLTDGAASLWVASELALKRLPANVPLAKLIDWEIASVDFRVEGQLMAPAFAIPRVLARNGLVYAGIDLWEIHEAFSAQVLFHIKALETDHFIRQKASVDRDLGAFPRERMNPNGGSVALGHPFAATGARIISQAVKELSMMPPRSRGIISICTDGGQGTVLLIEKPKS